MTEIEIFSQDRGERNEYKQASMTDQVRLPLTEDGFEALLERVCEIVKIPVTDSGRQVLSGYVHHIPNEQDSTTIEMLTKVLHKSVSNATTWRIDQAIKQKARDATQAKAKEDAGKANQQGNGQVLPLKSPDAG